MSELRQFKLPDVGEGLTEAEIVRWHVQPGDTVKVNQIIVEIETAKAVVELPSPYAGTVSELLVSEGATVDVGTPIISVSTGAAGPGAGGSAGDRATKAAAAGAAPPSAADQAGPAERAAALEADLVPSPPADGGAANGGAPAAAEPAPERQAVLVGYGVKLSSKTRRTRKPGAVPAQPAPSAPSALSAQPAPPVPSITPAPSVSPITAAPTVTPVSPAPPATSADGAVLAKPPVRKLARDLGVDLGTLTGTGPNGSITRDDVQGAVSQAPAAALDGRAGMTAVAREERIPIRGVRKHTAAAMTRSAFTAPHVSMFLDIDITETMAATERLKALPDFADVRVSPLLLVSRALLTAVARHPMINSSWDEAAQEIVVMHYVNLGIAAATERGLVVPNIKDAHAMSLPELARALTELSGRARAGKSAPAELAGGTISITNVGVFGVDTGTPILPPGETAILALGQVKDAPWVHRGELAVRKVCTLGMSFDHRIVDGDLGAAVLRDVGAMLTDPLRMLAWS
jgi:2-oxoisovalerate dehydrogenase E2 component (dihydrolipoyl transacylase)